MSRRFYSDRDDTELVGDDHKTVWVKMQLASSYLPVGEELRADMRMDLTTAQEDAGRAAGATFKNEVRAAWIKFKNALEAV